MSELSKEKIDDVSRLFADAEAAIKEIELIAQELPVPAVNELRYAAYHLLRAHGSLNVLPYSKEEGVEDDASLEPAEQLNRAAKHCRRSIYDAYEWGVLYFTRYVEEFRTTYVDHSRHVTDTISGYQEKLANVDVVSDELIERRKSNQYRRDEFYEQCQESCSKLKLFVRELKNSEPEIRTRIQTEIEEVEATEAEKKKLTRRYVVTVLLSILGILVAVGLTIWRIQATA